MGNFSLKIIKYMNKYVYFSFSGINQPIWILYCIPILEYQSYMVLYVYMLPLLTCSWLKIDLNILVIIYLRLIFVEVLEKWVKIIEW